MNKIEIEIPVGKEVDWEASAQQKQIVFKDRQLTYEDVCDKLFEEGRYHTDADGNICFVDWINDCPNNATTKHQLECILAKNKLANTARYLNGKWDYYANAHRFIIYVNGNNKDKLEIRESHYMTEKATVFFKSTRLAQQAIEILGEETVKLALEPLY